MRHDAPQSRGAEGGQNGNGVSEGHDRIVLGRRVHCQTRLRRDGGRATRMLPIDCGPTTSSSARPPRPNRACNSARVRLPPREPMPICMSNDAPASSARVSGSTTSGRAMRAGVAAGGRGCAGCRRSHHRRSRAARRKADRCPSRSEPAASIQAGRRPRSAGIRRRLSGARPSVVLPRRSPGRDSPPGRSAEDGA